MIHKFSSGYETKPIIDILGFSAALSKLRLSIGIKITENQTAAVICDDFMILNFSFCVMMCAVTKPQRAGHLGNFKVVGSRYLETYTYVVKGSNL